jgi:hypothetical protein
VTRPHIDLRSTLGRSAPFLRDFDPSAILVGAAPDQIRRIDCPLFDSPDQVRGLVPLSSPVIGLDMNGDARAYPVDLLSYHEVVNDEVGGRPVVITWCPLCQTALVYGRRIEGRTLHFAVSGYLYEANLMLYDRETGSLWNQVLGGAVTGPLRGSTLALVPVVYETWGAWLAQHPDTRVLSIKRDELADRFLHPFYYDTSRGREYSDAPYESYVEKVPFYFYSFFRGLRDSAFVYGLTVGISAKAYPLGALVEAGAINDTLGREPIVVISDEAATSAFAYARRLGGRTLSFRRVGSRLFDRETGSRWAPATGRALAGPLAGSRLTRLAGTQVYWFAWRKIRPATALYRG